jgi:hypothetical protein
MTEEYFAYKRDEKPLPSLDLSGHSKRVEELIYWFESKGINVSSSRIPKYRIFIDSLIKRKDFNPAKSDEDHKLFDELLYTLREIHELIWIKEGLDCGEPKGIEEILKTIVGGSSFAKDDQVTKARNYQFELRIASYFLQKGYEVDMSSISDIVAINSKSNFYIECKRLYSEKKIKTRISEAAKQLKQRVGKNTFLSNKVGIAVFDVTKIAFPHQGLTWGVNDKHCKEVIRRKLIEVVQNFDFEGPFRNNKNVIGIWLQIHIPSLLLSFGQPTTRFSSQFIIMTSEKGFRGRALKHFQEVYEVYGAEL